MRRFWLWFRVQFAQSEIAYLKEDIQQREEELQLGKLELEVKRRHLRRWESYLQQITPAHKVIRDATRPRL